jgi:enamine deaminase RidA (YjgF/YER057c/UK114 family)
LKVTIYLQDIEAGVKAFNEAWDEWKDPEHLPARTTVEAKMVSHALCFSVHMLNSFPPSLLHQFFIV